MNSAVDGKAQQCHPSSGGGLRLFEACPPSEAIVEVWEDWHSQPPQMGCDHHHHLRELSRCTGKAKWEHRELTVLLAYLKLQIAFVRLQDGNVDL